MTQNVRSVVSPIVGAGVVTGLDVGTMVTGCWVGATVVGRFVGALVRGMGLGRSVGVTVGKEAVAAALPVFANWAALDCPSLSRRR